MSEKSFFSNFSPKQSFFMGVGGVAVLFFVVGFFVLLGKASGGGGSGVVAGSQFDNPPSAGAPVPTPSDPPTPANVQISDVSKADHIRGDRGAKVSIVEYSDFQCPFCNRVHPTLTRLIEDYNGQVNWVYRHFPLDSIHPEARPAAVASECIADLAGNDAFWNFSDKLFENQAVLGQALYERLAGEVGANVDKFKDCVSSGKFDQHVQDNYTEVTSAGGRGTPYSIIVVGDQKIPISGAVPYEQFKATIDPLL